MDSFTEQIQPHGLSLKRKWYLYEKIRVLCSHETRDLVCPHLEHPQPSLPKLHLLHFPKKRQQICGSCGEAGHNKRRCTQNNSNNSFGRSVSGRNSPLLHLHQFTKRSCEVIPCCWSHKLLWFTGRGLKSLLYSLYIFLSWCFSFLYFCTYT